MHPQCERLAAETGCWLYISGQHVNAKTGFCNYASPRVRRDAREEVTEIHNSSNMMYTMLLGARRSGAIELSAQAEKSKVDLKKAQDEIAAQSAQIMQLQSELLRQRLSIT